MKLDKRKLALFLNLVIILSLIFAVSAQAAMTELVVTKITQAKTNWCWAAAAEMAGKYKYSSSTRTQTDAVIYKKGSSSVNEVGDVYETEDATEYITYDNYGLSATLPFFPWSFNKVKSSIDKGYPVIALVRGGGTGHYYVIRGYDGSTNEIALNDPWDGTRKVVTWSDFDSGNWTDSRPYTWTVYFNNAN